MSKNNPLSAKIEKSVWVLSELRKVITAPETELAHESPFQLLVAVILSAQCTDARVNIVTPALFAAFPNAEALSQASIEDIFPFIQSISFPNNKAKHLEKLGKILMAQHSGEVPKSVEEIEKLPGAGHKTASVVASVAFGIPALPVDTHVFRVSNRIGLVENAPTVEAVEQQLKAVIPREEWATAHHLIILHGRYTCTAQKPKCESCTISAKCNYFAELQNLPQPIQGLKHKLGAFYCANCEEYHAKAFFEIRNRLKVQGDQEIQSCPHCHSQNVFNSKTGKTVQKPCDFRV